MIEDSVEKAAKGMSIAEKTEEALNKIMASITKVTDLIDGIATSSNEQAHGIEQINQGLSQIDRVTQSNTANAEQSAAASEELSSQAEQLRKTLSHFKLGSTFNISTVSNGSEMQSVSNDIGWTEVGRG